jgi:hypothetical protein
VPVSTTTTTTAPTAIPTVLAVRNATTPRCTL